MSACPPRYSSRSPYRRDGARKERTHTVRYTQLASEWAKVSGAIDARVPWSRFNVRSNPTPRDGPPPLNGRFEVRPETQRAMLKAATRSSPFGPPLRPFGSRPQSPSHPLESMGTKVSAPPLNRNVSYVRGPAAAQVSVGSRLGRARITSRVLSCRSVGTVSGATHAASPTLI